MLKMAAPSAKVLLIYGRHGALRAAIEPLRALSLGLDARETLEGVGLLSAYDVAIVDFETLSEKERGRLLRSFSLPTATRLVLLTNGGRERDLMPILKGGVGAALLAKNRDDFELHELLATLQKLTSQDLFGLEKYLMWGVETQARPAVQPQQRAQLLGEAATFVSGKGLHPRYIEVMRDLVDELLSVTTLWSHSSELSVRFGFDGRTLGVSVTDSQGVLERDAFFDSATKALARANGAEDAAAVLGVTQLLQSLTHWVINLDPGERLETLGLVSVRTTYRSFAAQRKSFSFFTKEVRLP